MDMPISAEQLAPLRGQPDVLISIIIEQSLLIAELRSQVATLTKRVEELEKQLNERPPSSAAPFRRERTPGDARPPGKPGRKPGHPPAWKHKPESIDDFAEAPLPCCPHCSGALEALQPLDQYIEDIVPAKKHVTHLRTHQGYCPKCERAVASTHPLQVSGAGGAAGTHLGPRALGVACWLKHHAGLSLARTSQTLRELCGITISRGALAQLFQRVAGKLEGDYEALRKQLLGSASVHTDETGWYVGAPGASLCVFCTPRATYYRVVPSKRREAFHEVIAPDWPGVLVSDCLSVYDNATAHQQKCYAHHLKAIKRAEQESGGAPEGSYLSRSRALLHTAMGKREGWEKRAPPEREQELRILRLAADALLETPRVDKPLEEAVRQRLHKQKDHLFVFLEKEGVEATNNLAERQLRAAVIARKLSCGQRTWAGAKAWQILASLAASAWQRAESFVELAASRCSLATE